MNNFRYLIIALLFLTSFGIRIYQIHNPPLDFHPTRQYRSAIIARSFYYKQIENIPEEKKQIAIINAQREGFLEPPLMEYVSSIVYKIVGKEDLFIPRIFSIIFWLIGGIIIYRIVIKLKLYDSAIIAVALFLFLPFGVSASRSFQPDPLMINLMLISLLMILSYDEKPTVKNLILASIVSSITIFIKPISLFLIFGSFTALFALRKGFGKSLLSSHILIYFIISLLPSLIYYLYGIYIEDFLRGQAQASFIPGLIFQKNYWKGWLEMIDKSVGITFFIIGLLSVFLCKDKKVKYFLIGLWIGYLIFAFTFTFHVHTHDYYHLQLIPIIALSICPLVFIIIEHIRKVNLSRFSKFSILTILTLALLLTFRTSFNKLKDFNNKFHEYKKEIAIASTVGNAVNNSSKTIILAKIYGKMLIYYGGFSGVYWPSLAEMRDYELFGEPPISVKERFNIMKEEIGPHFFIITDFKEFDIQNNLRDYLTTRYPILISNTDFIIYDLRD
jgi:hypothetical protein